MFEDLDPADFWEASEYAAKKYVDDPLTEDKITSTERALGYKLPPAYVALMKLQNGGFPKKTRHRTTEPTSWSHDHVAMTGFYSIGGTKPNSLCGSFGSTFWIDAWEYPPIGVYFADCPSAGHDMLCLDYRDCGPTGEPRVLPLVTPATSTVHSRAQARSFRSPPRVAPARWRARRRSTPDKSSPDRRSRTPGCGTARQSP